MNISGLSFWYLSFNSVCIRTGFSVLSMDLISSLERELELCVINPPSLDLLDGRVFCFHVNICVNPEKSSGSGEAKFASTAKKKQKKKNLNASNLEQNSQAQKGPIIIYRLGGRSEDF